MQRKTKMVDVVQSVRTSDCGSEGRRFEPDLPPSLQKRMCLFERIFFFYVLSFCAIGVELSAAELGGGAEGTHMGGFPSLKVPFF